MSGFFTADEAQGALHLVVDYLINGQGELPANTRRALGRILEEIELVVVDANIEQKADHGAVRETAAVYQIT